MTEMTIRERIARKLCERCGMLPDHPFGNGPRWKSELSTIDLVLAELREPTEEMVIAAYDTVGPGFCDEPGDPLNPREAWEAMIDVVMGESHD